MTVDVKKPAKGGRDSPQYVLRLPQDLKDWLKHRAIDNHRSFNSEVLYRLEQSRNQQEANHANAA